jgi:hypothetical protein
MTSSPRTPPNDSTIKPPEPARGRKLGGLRDLQQGGGATPDPTGDGVHRKVCSRVLDSKRGRLRLRLRSLLK